MSNLKTVQVPMKPDDVNILIRCFEFMIKDLEKFQDVLYSINADDLQDLIVILSEHSNPLQSQNEIVVTFDSNSWVSFFGALCALNNSIPLDSQQQYEDLYTLKNACSDIDDRFSGPFPT